MTFRRQITEAQLLDALVARGRLSLRTRLERWRSKWWVIGQCSLAASAAWVLAHDVLGHPNPFFAPIAAVVTLGTSYGQRLTRVVEVTLGVALGVLIGDLLVARLGSGWWQLGIIVAMAMSAAVMLNARQLFIAQAGVQSIVVTVMVATPGAAFTRWLDAVIGGAVALVAAMVVPAAALRRPREQAGKVIAKISGLLRASARAIRDRELDQALDLLADARSTDYLIRELQDAADEGVDVTISSPLWLGRRHHARRMVELVEPLDRALRNTRVLVRQVAVGAYRQYDMPPEYAVLVADLSVVVDQLGEELLAERSGETVRLALITVGVDTTQVPRIESLAAQVILATTRAIIADLLMLTGMSQLESTDALPPLPNDPG